MTDAQKLFSLALLSTLLVTSVSSFAQANALSYRSKNEIEWKIPDPDSHLPTVEAKEWLAVTQTPTVIEGPAFWSIRQSLFNRCDEYSGSQSQSRSKNNHVLSR